MIIEILLGVILILLLLLIFLVKNKNRNVEPRDIEYAISNVWMNSGLEKSVGAITTYAEDIRNDYKSLEQMLRVPTERASLGELSLETILSDQLPSDMVGIRERVFDGKIPDAYIKSTVGLICIDSKFPLDNYRNMVDAKEPKEKEGFKKQFVKDVQGHLSKIFDDYVCPEKGSAEFAFAYIPSEGVYYFLKTEREAFNMLRDYAKKGVQVVSPLTLSQLIELIKAGIHAKKLSENVEKVNNNLHKLSKQFCEIDRIWQVFYKTHFKNLEGKAEELDIAYKKLKDEFNSCEKIQ